MKALYALAASVLLILVPAAAPLLAQNAALRPPPAETDTTVIEPPNGLRFLRLAKWSTLAGAVGAGIYGFIQNERAEEQFRELEQLCEGAPERCGPRTNNGAYADPAFEARYQQIRGLDRESHVALLASQIGVAATVALFLLDLGNTKPPPDIPYVPRGLSFRSDGHGRVELQWRIADF